MTDAKGQGVMLASNFELIRKIETLPPDALRELDHFIDFLYFTYKLPSPIKMPIEAINTNPLAALAGSWQGELVREPQGKFDVRVELD